MSWSPIGRPVRVGLFEHSPDAYSCFRMLPQKSCPKPGSEVEIVQIVMNMLDWEWEVVDTNEAFVSCIHAISDTNAYPCRGLLMISEIRRRMGIIREKLNGLFWSSSNSFSGIMGLLADNKIDMSGLSLRITPDRMTRAHFTFPIRYFQVI